MKRPTPGTILALLATFAISLVVSPAIADSRQKNKNDWRNLAGIAGAIAGYGLLKHNSTATLLGAAGAAYSANRYERDRHSQSQQNGYRSRYYRSQGYGNDGNGNYGYANRGYAGNHNRSYRHEQGDGNDRDHQDRRDGRDERD